MIQIESYKGTCLLELRFTAGEEERILPHVSGIFRKGGCYYRYGNAWDCSGDFAWALLFASAGSPVDGGDKRICLKLWQRDELTAQFYTRETLVKIFSRLDDWTVCVHYKRKEDENMSENKFLVRCPQFGMDYAIRPIEARRDYAHPVDSTLIKFLDNPAVNSVFRQLIGIVADSTYGPVVASAIPISESNYPEINRIVDDCVTELNIKRPYVVISSMISGLNAMAFGNDEEAYIAVSPLMVKTMSERQLRFVIGHECGHVAMGHMVYHTVISIATAFASAVPVIGPVVDMVGTLPLKAWSRRSEITADRAGLLCCGDVEVAQKALLQLEMPFMNPDDISLEGYVEGSDKYLKEGVIRRLNEFNNAHPIIPKRIHALQVFVSSEKYCRITGKPALAGAIGETELNQQTEEIIKII